MKPERAAPLLVMKKKAQHNTAQLVLPRMNRAKLMATWHERKTKHGTTAGDKPVQLNNYEKTHPHSILQVPTTQLANMSIDPKFVELTADVLEIFL